MATRIELRIHCRQQSDSLVLVALPQDMQSPRTILPLLQEMRAFFFTLSA
jgi:hypothetical protein